LKTIKAAFADVSRLNRTMAAANGAEDLGMDELAVVDVIAGLSARDFDKSMPSNIDSAIWQDAYRPVHARCARRVAVDQLQGEFAMTNPRDYPDTIQSAESGRMLRRGVKLLTIDVDGQTFTYGQPGWRASIDDPTDTEGQLIDDDNVVRAAARREARANARHATLSPLVIRAIREVCGLSQQDAARVFGGGPKAFEKYESGEVVPSSAMTRLLLLAAKHPDLFAKGSGRAMLSEADASLIRDTVRKSSVERLYEPIYASRPVPEPERA
jgi:HTH-type transcriptional regulator/antitoxin MqsA